MSRAAGDDLAPVDEHVLDALRLRVEPLAPSGEVVAHLRRAAADASRVEHDEIGDPSFGDAPAVAEPVEARGHVGELVDGLFEREQRPVAHRLAEQHRGVVGVAHQVGVRAGVGAAEHRAVVAPHARAHPPALVRSSE